MKKKPLLAILAAVSLAAALALTACSGGSSAASSAVSSAQSVASSSVSAGQVASDAAADAAVDVNTKALVVYFSVPDNKDNSYVETNGQQLGNTQYMAQVIQETTGADMFRIQPTTPYPTDHDELSSAAQQERRTNARPEIAGSIDDFDSYDVVFVGYPIWNADLPYIMYTFFKAYDLSGKTIIPFSTHGGSGFSGTPETIASLEPNARMLDGLSISRDSIEGARQEIIDWLAGLGFATVE